MSPWQDEIPVSGEHREAEANLGRGRLPERHRGESQAGGAQVEPEEGILAEREGKCKLPFEKRKFRPRLSWSRPPPVFFFLFINPNELQTTSVKLISNVWPAIKSSQLIVIIYVKCIERADRNAAPQPTSVFVQAIDFLFNNVIIEIILKIIV